MHNQIVEYAKQVCLAAIPILGILWLLGGPEHLTDLVRYLYDPSFDWVVLTASYVLIVLGLAIAAGFLTKPYGERSGYLELGLALVAILCWCWASWNYEFWLEDIADRSAEKWVPGLIGLLLMIEAIRKSCGLAITVLVALFLVYGLWGHFLPGVFEAEEISAPRLILYLYSDINGVPGLVLRVGATVVLGFILMGKAMEMSGGSQFFTDSAMCAMGHRRGGPAKVSVVASSIFGTISGTTVGNIMSTGIVTIPLMKRFGFPARYAAAIEAVASNGGQLAPPVMGTTAFLIAEFLQVDYPTVAMAALAPAVIYYFVIFLQVDRFSKREGLTGVPRADLPVFKVVFRKGWIFLAPLALLFYLLFWLGYSPGKSALYTAGVMLVLGLALDRRVPGIAFWREFIVGGGQGLIPLLLVCSGAGLIIGVLNISGLGFSISGILTDLADTAGLLVVLIAAAFISIILGMGMPTAAVYIVLAVLLGPALVDMGVEPMAAHLFIFYFGLLSMLTPPVAIASFVAAGLAKADMWETGVTGLKLASAAYLLPFLFVYNPALLFLGTWQEFIIVVITVIVSGALLAEAIEGVGGEWSQWLTKSLPLAVASLLIGSATIWLAPDSWLATGPAVAGALVLAYHKRRTETFEARAA